MNRRLLLTAGFGIGLIGLGVAVWVDPSIAETVGVVSLIEQVGNPIIPVFGVAILALLLACFVAMTAVISKRKAAEMPSVEGFITTDSPGDEFEIALAELAGRHGRAVRPTKHRELIETRLREDAVRTVVRVDGCDNVTARERVSSGAWTDDRYAAAFVTENISGPKWWQRLRDWLVRADSFERSALRTANAIATYSDTATKSRAAEEPQGGGNS